MKRISVGYLQFLLVFAAVMYAATSVAKQSGIPSQATDPIVGKWKLDVDKSTNPPHASELITIESQGNGFKMVFDAENDNGYKPRYSLITEMKGETVKSIPTDGKQTDDAWRVTRNGPRSFDMELSTKFGGWTDKYEVSSDGKTLTGRRIQGKTGVIGGVMDRNGVAHPVQVIAVFDRVP
jgi:hypothetical protein